MEKKLPRGSWRDMSPRYRAFRWTMISLGRLLFGFTVAGAEKAPAEGPLIVVANHRSYADPVLVSMAVPRKVRWMAKKELFVFPFEKMFYFIGAFPVDREKGGRAALRSALAFLKAGRTLGIFPEGTRRKGYYEPDHTPKSGAGMLASRGNAPVLPVFVGKLPNPLERLRGERLHIRIGEPINMDNTMSGGRAYGEAMEGILRGIYALGEGIEGARSSGVRTS